MLAQAALVHTGAVTHSNANCALSLLLLLQLLLLQGMVREHDFDTVIVNGTPVEPPFAYAWINLDPWLTGERERVAIPTAHSRAVGMSNPAVAVPAHTAARSAPAAAVAALASAAAAAVSGVTTVQQQMQQQQHSPAAAAVTGAGALALAAATNSPKRKGPSFAWPKIDVPTQCEDSWDCDSPMVCCDFAFFKVCCNQGMGSPVQEPRLIPIPIPVEEEYPRYPPQYPPYGDRW
jgi:hypothetical protein